MKRRSFLQKAVFGLGIAGFSSLPFGFSRLLYPKANAAIANYTILPGALADPEAFIEACIGCGLCGEVFIKMMVAQNLIHLILILQ